MAAEIVVFPNGDMSKIQHISHLYLTTDGILIMGDSEMIITHIIEPDDYRRIIIHFELVKIINFYESGISYVPDWDEIFKVLESK